MIAKLKKFFDPDTVANMAVIFICAFLMGYLLK